MTPSLAENVLIADVAERRAKAIVQHERVMQEAARVARLTQQARNVAASRAVFADVTRHSAALRSRVVWMPDHRRAS